MCDLSISVEDDPGKADADFLSEQMRRFNAPFLGAILNKTLAVFLRDGAGTILGGAQAFTCLEWLYLSGLWVQEGARGKGHGSRILVALETQAAARRCHSSFVDTYEFQALGFYRKRGYEVMGGLENHPAPYKRYFLSKKINPLGPVILRGISRV